MTLQTLTQPTDPFALISTRKRSNNRKRPRNFEDEEAEYLAKCLVQLANGTSQVLEPPLSVHLKHLRRQENTKTTTDVIKKDQETTLDVKKDRETKIHVCNVCSKSFSCHQALGGHKASHRDSKPRTEDLDLKRNKKSRSSSDGKIHECATCHKIFPSYQALGGHMRKHYDGVIGVGVSAKNRSTEAEAKSPSNESGASVSTATGRVVREVFDLNVSLTEDNN